jgi:hypothetical protein
MLLRLFDDDTELIDHNKLKAQAQKDLDTNGHSEADVTDEIQTNVSPAGTAQDHTNETPL